MKKQFVTKSPKETVVLGRKLGKSLSPGTVVYLVGELGTGKTVLANGLAQGYGIKKQLRSPSFVLVCEYPEKKFYHLDLYRINEKDYIFSGLNQYLSPENICVIEWADKIKQYWSKKYWEIKLELVDKKKNYRKITFLSTDSEN